jgi:hypothetical protein
VLLQCICILQPQLVHLFQSSSLLPSLLLLVVPTSLRFLYSFLYSEHIHLIQVLASFPCPIPPGHSLPLVWHVSHNIAAFILGLQSAYEGKHEAFGLLSLANFT